MKSEFRGRFAALLCFVALSRSNDVSAAEVRVMISAGFLNVYSQLAPGFERTTGHHLVTIRGPSTGDSPEAIPTRLSRGESADVVILEGGSADELVKKGVVRADTKVVLALAQTGVAVRAGVRKPDIGSVDAFRNALLSAHSIAYSDSGSGRYFVETLLPRLGIADRVMIKARKVRGPPSGEPVAAVVARGEAELGLQDANEIIHVPGISYVGPIPAELDRHSSYAAAVTIQAAEPQAAMELIELLSSRKADALIVQDGLTLPGRHPGK